MVRASISKASGEGSGPSSILSQKRQRSGDKGKRVDREDKRLSTTLLDLNILDCPICFEALKIPIFQCDNGHIACSSCCPKLSTKCPVCALPIGDKRCRAMESVLESIFIPCQNAKLGCTKKFTYGKESTHDKECTFSPCSCPAQDCDYTASYKDLYFHYGLIHLRSYMELCNMFSCGTHFDIRMNISDKIRIQREYKKSPLFPLQCFREPDGVYVTVSCIAPSIPEVGQFSYELSYTTADGYTLTFKSPEVKRVLKVSIQTPKDNFMLIPNTLLRGELLDMKLCIQKLNQA